MAVGRNKTGKEGQTNINYKALANLITYPIKTTPSMLKGVLTWLAHNVNKPGFDLNKLIIQPYGRTNGDYSCLHLIAAGAQTELDKELFVKMIEIIPSSLLKGFKFQIKNTI